MEEYWLIAVSVRGIRVKLYNLQTLMDMGDLQGPAHSYESLPTGSCHPGLPHRFSIIVLHLHAQYRLVRAMC